MSVPPFELISQVHRATENMTDKVAYIVVHPEDGVFLGIDSDKQPVFAKLTEIDAHQAIPTYTLPEYILSGSCADPKILEATMHLVDLDSTYTHYAMAGDVIKDGKIKTTAKRDEDLQVKLGGNVVQRMLHYFNHVADKFLPAAMAGPRYKAVETAPKI